MSSNDSVHSLVNAIAAQRGLILVLTGAGVSLASGIPTFRGTDKAAVWNSSLKELATFAYFQRNPVASWEWYRDRFSIATAAQPNPAHLALAELEKWQAARGGEFLLVTQNIDTLHEMAGSRDLVKVHGSADRVRCSNPGCSSTATIPLADVDLTAFERRPAPETLLRCSECGAVMRPHVLWFDETYTSHRDYEWSRVEEACDNMELLLAIGTSFSVGLTDYVLSAAHHRRVPTFIIDPGSTSNGGLITSVPAKAEHILPEVCEGLRGL
jgi:NAD-dependent deacetylase